MPTPNKIVQAFREGVEEKLPPELLVSNILRACLEECGEDKEWNQITGREGRIETDGYNTAKQEVRDVISEAIKEIEDE